MKLHGLIFWSFESFLTFTYGEQAWHDIMSRLDLGYYRFEPLYLYEHEIGDALLIESCRQFKKSPTILLEDFGTFLVTDKRVDRVRRLLRFGGVNYTDFLHSLEELPGRAQLAVPDLFIPLIELNEVAPDKYEIICRNSNFDVGYVLLGMLRALADDYGALAFLEHLGRKDGNEVVSVHLLEMQHGEGRAFYLAGDRAT